MASTIFEAVSAPLRSYISSLVLTKLSQFIKNIQLEGRWLKFVVVGVYKV